MTVSCRFRTLWGKYSGKLDYLRTRIEDYDGTWTKDMNIDQLRRKMRLSKMLYLKKKRAAIRSKKRIINPVR